MAKNKVADGLTFEKALEGLEGAAANLIKTDITLEEAIGSFEKGIEYYNKCNEILSEAKQKINVYSG